MTKLSLLALVLVGACTTVESNNILTSGMSADISARATGDGTTTVSATLYLGNPIDLNFVDLTADDQLRASNGDQAKVMSESILLNIVSHTAVFQTDAADDEFVVDLVRSVDQGAPHSIATLPAPFEIDPIAATSSRAQPVSLTWPTSTDLIRWAASGECIDSAFQTVALDAGGATIPAGTLHKREGQQIADSCLVTVTVSRVRIGDLDIHYGKGGVFSGEQSRTVSFTSTP